MKARTSDSQRTDILGNRSRSNQEVFSSVLKQWGRRLGYCSVLAAVPAMTATQAADASSDVIVPPKPSATKELERLKRQLNLTRNTPALLRRQSKFLLPHQRGNFSLLPAVAGNDNCPGRSVPGGTYSFGAPYVDTGDTTGANNTISRNYYIDYYYYSYDSFGPDHIYSFMITDVGPIARIQVTTTSSTYKPMVYFLHGARGGCPAGTDNHAFNMTTLDDSRWGSGNTITFEHPGIGYLRRNVPIHMVIDSRANDSSGAGPYRLEMRDITIANSCPVSIDCNEYFIQQHYADFLDRDPDPQGFAAWLALLNGCNGDPNCDRIHVSSAFFRSSEFQGRGYFLYRFYPVAFGRKPDYEDFRSNMLWISGFYSDSELEARKRLFINSFMNQTAFVVRFGSLSNDEYVDRLLQTAGITHPARDLWVAALGNGARTRAEVLREIVESAQVYDKYYNEAFVVMQYFGYLRRQPDALYLDWINYLNATGDYRGMVSGFVNSIEYRNRFLQP